MPAKKPKSKRNPFADSGKFLTDKELPPNVPVEQQDNTPTLDDMKKFVRNTDGPQDRTDEQIINRYKQLTTGKNKGGVVKKKKLAKGGFPDLSGDGKVTQKDVLMGRGAMNKGGMYAAGGYVTDMMGKKKK